MNETLIASWLKLAGLILVWLAKISILRRLQCLPPGARWAALASLYAKLKWSQGPPRLTEVIADLKAAATDIFWRRERCSADKDRPLSVKRGARTPQAGRIPQAPAEKCGIPGCTTLER